MTTILQARPRQFVNTPAIERVSARALRYLQSGFSVHLRGPAGTGKTTLALHLADLLGRPIMLLFGDDEFKTSDLIGNQTGYTRKKVFDNFIHSVVKVEDELRHNWVDSRLTLACREGFTLVYDEFNRSRPEVNNVLLSALEEKLLVLPPNGSRNEYIRVSPHFRAIFTSNPTEYCGVHETQDALLDRLVTLNMAEPDELTQQEIIIQKTSIDREGAAFIVQLVKAFRTEVRAHDSSGLRSCLMLAKVCQEHGISVVPENPEFRDICHDILLSRTGLPVHEATQILWNLFNLLIGLDSAQDSVVEFLQTSAESSIADDEWDSEVDLTSGLVDKIHTTDLDEIFSQIRETASQQSVSQVSDEIVREVLGHLHDELTDTGLASESELVHEGVDNAVLNAPAGLTAITYAPGEVIPEDVGISISDIEAVNALDDIDVDAMAEPVSASISTSFVETVPFEHDVYLYLQQFHDARPSQIETELGISRFQAVNALQALSNKGLLDDFDRAERNSASSHPNMGS